MRSQFWFELGQNLTPIYSLSFTSPQKPIERFLTISDGPGWLLRSWERSNDKGPNIGFLRTITPRTFRFWGFAVLWENCRGGWYPKEIIQHCISLFFYCMALHALVQSCAFRFWGLIGCGKNGDRWSVSKDSLNFIAAKETKWKYPALCCCIAALEAL